MSNIPPPPQGSPPPPPPNDPGASGTSHEPPMSPAPRGSRVLVLFFEAVIFVGLYVATILVWWAVDVSRDERLSMVSDPQTGGFILPIILTDVSSPGLVVFVPWIILAALFFGASSSLAKRSARMLVVDSRTGQPASVLQMALREWGGKVGLAVLTGGLSLIVGAVMVLVTGRGLWDFIARTTVVKHP